MSNFVREKPNIDLYPKFVCLNKILQKLEKNYLRILCYFIQTRFTNIVTIYAYI